MAGCPRCSEKEGARITIRIADDPETGTRVMECSGRHHRWKEDKEDKVVLGSVEILD